VPAGMQRDAGRLEVIPRHHGEKRESSTKIVSFLSDFDKQACFGEGAFQVEIKKGRLISDPAS